MVTEKSNLPCVDCICMPICKAQYLQIKASQGDNVMSTLGRIRLQQKCDILENYVKFMGPHFDIISIFHTYMNKSQRDIK